VENQHHEMFITKKNRFRSNLGTRFLSSNGLGFGDFWSRTENFRNRNRKIPKDFFFFRWTIFPRGICNHFCIHRFSSYFFARLNMSYPDSLLKSPRGLGFSCYFKLRPTKPDLNVSKFPRAFKC
jgi:hypothetical protein